MSEWPEDVKVEDKNKTCLTVFFAGGNRQPVEIVGNFKNGLLGKYCYLPSYFVYFILSPTLDILANINVIKR